ncbi:MAG: hypothetical protein CMJ80_10970 [Planctomycetaceae bacterium]|nr:hypothetical protein [Planctomycetaceae bacterium]
MAGKQECRYKDDQPLVLLFQARRQWLKEQEPSTQGYYVDRNRTPRPTSRNCDPPIVNGYDLKRQPP